MASKRIGIILAMDGEKEFVQQINNINKQTRLMQTELANVTKQYEGNANSMEALQARQQALSRIQAAYRQKLDMANTGLNKAAENYQKQGERLKELEKQLKEAKEAQEEMEKSGDTASKAYERQSREVESLSDAVERQRLAQLRESGSVTDWNRRLAEAERQLRDANRAVEQNTQYLREAEDAADGCARSMDRFGEAVGESGGELEGAAVNWKDKFASAVATKGLSLAADAVGAVADKAKEAAEYVIDVGSSFEAGMSEVAAISGATEKDLDKLSEKAKKLGATTKFTATEAAGAFKYMSLAGWDTQKMLSGIDGVLGLAAASGMELAAASDMVTDYLSAFGMEAEKSAYMADMLAYAQANSNTTAEQLGDAYGNCAANLNAAGQDIETVTALLEGMANQGLKGSEAGTALGSIMTQITQKMENGRIKIGETLVAVADSNGNFRDMTDILADVSGALSGMGTEERSAALAATFNKTALSGLNLVLNEGIDKVAGYEEELRNADGAAAAMAETMQDNLAGDMTKAGSALEGLGIAAYGYIEGPVRGVVQGVTSAISGITDAITPQKSVLEKFIGEVGESNRQVGALLENAKASMENASGDVANMEAYKDKLLELNDAMDKTEYQKYEMRTIVSELADSIPQLAAAFDEEACNINLSSDAISALMENQEAFIMQQAAIEARTDAMNALMEAELNVAKAEGALQEAQEKHKEAQEKRNEALGDSQNRLKYLLGDYHKEVTKYEEAILEANLVLGKAKKAEEEAREEYQITSTAVDDATEKIEGYVSSIKDIPSGAEDAASAMEGFAGAAGEDLENVSMAAEEAAQAFGDMKEGIADSIKNSVSMLDEFSGGAEATAEEIKKNLDSQIEGVSQWSENMKTLAGAAGQGMSQELYDALAGMGPESANLVNTLVGTLTSDMERGTGEFGEICRKWQEAMKLQDESEVVASYTSLKDGIAEAVEGVPGEIKEVSKEAQEGAKSGIEENRPKVVGAARETAKAAQEAMLGEAPGFQTVGRNMMLGVAEGIDAGAPLVYNKIRQVMAQAKKEGNEAIDSHSPSRVWRNQVGAYIPQGLALGISDGQKGVSEAAVNLAKAALKGAKGELGINSPSKAFRDQVGKQIPAGVTLGIKQAKDGAVKSSKDFASEIYREAEKQLEKIKKNNAGKVSVTLDDIGWYWDRLLKESKKKGREFYGEMKKLIKEQKQEIAQQRKSEGLSSQSQALDAYKTYYGVSEKAEMQYWDKARKKYKEGTNERLEADKKYYSAKEEYYSKLEGLELDYGEICKEISDRQKEQAKEIEESYQEALSNRKEQIREAFGLFDEFQSESDGPGVLLENMESQVKGYAIWAGQLKELEEKGALGEGFISELRQMGPQAAATVASLNTATQEQLVQMQRMWEEKYRISAEQAARETEALRQSAKEQIKAVSEAAQEELAARQAEYEAARKKITEGISGELAGLASDAYRSGNDAVAALVAAIRKKVGDKGTQGQLNEAKEGILGQMEGLKGSGKQIGDGMLDGVLKALGNQKKIKKSAKEFVDALEKAIKKEAGIASPSKRFREVIGMQIPAGVAQGIEDGAKTAQEAGADMVEAMLRRANESLNKSREAAAAELSGTGAGLMSLGRAIQAPAQQAANITVDNTAAAKMLAGLLEEVREAREEISRVKVVLDTGELVGRITESVGDGLAMQAVRF